MRSSCFCALVTSLKTFLRKILKTYCFIFVYDGYLSGEEWKDLVALEYHFCDHAHRMNFQLLYSNLNGCHYLPIYRLFSFNRDGATASNQKFRISAWSLMKWNMIDIQVQLLRLQVAAPEPNRESSG